MELFAKGMLLSLSLCLDIGVVNIALIRTALVRGTRPALMLGLGSALGDLVYALISATAVAVVLQLRGVRLALWLGGSLVLLGLAIRMTREALHPQPLPRTVAGAEVPTAALGASTTETAPARGAPAGPRSDGADFRRGVALALASPSSLLWFAAVGGSIIAANAGSRAALLPFMSGFAAGGIVWGVALSITVGRTRHLIGRRAIAALSAASALLFAYFAIDVFVRGYAQFVGEATDRPA